MAMTADAEVLTWPLDGLLTYLAAPPRIDPTPLLGSPAPSAAYLDLVKERCSKRGPVECFDAWPAVSGLPLVDRRVALAAINDARRVLGVPPLACLPIAGEGEEETIIDVSLGGGLSSPTMPTYLAEDVNGWGDDEAPPSYEPFKWLVVYDCPEPGGGLVASLLAAAWRTETHLTTLVAPDEDGRPETLVYWHVRLPRVLSQLTEEHYYGLHPDLLRIKCPKCREPQVVADHVYFCPRCLGVR